MDRNEAAQAAERLRDLLQSAKHSVLEMGLALIEMRDNASPDRFQNFVETAIPPMDPDIRERIMEGAAKGIDGITDELLVAFAEDAAENIKKARR